MGNNALDTRAIQPTTFPIKLKIESAVKFNVNKIVNIIESGSVISRVFSLKFFLETINTSIIGKHHSKVKKFIF